MMHAMRIAAPAQGRNAALTSLRRSGDQLTQAVKRNRERFPDDFMFQLTGEEAAGLRSQTLISNPSRGGRRYAPYAFTEHGVTMLAAVLQSPRAVQVGIEVVRAFVRLRAMLAGNAELARKLTP